METFSSDREQRSHLFRFKDRISMRLRSNVIYKFTCQRCYALHLGETTRNLHTRICEHLGISAYTGNEIPHPSSLSSILAHNRETGHPVSFDDFSILASGRSELDTLIRENLLIQKINPSLNVNIRSFPLRLFWFLFFSFLLHLNPCFDTSFIILSYSHLYFCNRVRYLRRKFSCKQILWWCCWLSDETLVPH